jgi:hypothetical protein
MEIMEITNLIDVPIEFEMGILKKQLFFGFICLNTFLKISKLFTSESTNFI